MFRGMTDITLGVQGMVLRVLHWLHPGQASRRAALFILEIAAALLSVLALSDGILGGAGSELPHGRSSRAIAHR
jgi:hypothetical protein